MNTLTKTVVYIFTLLALLLAIITIVRVLNDAFIMETFTSGLASVLLAILAIITAKDII